MEGVPVVSMKLVIIGDMGVGKTSILLRFVDDLFDESPVVTIGMDYKSKSVQIGESSFDVQIWDTAGQERFGNATSSFYRRTDLAFIVYDVSSEKSFRKIDSWIHEVDDFATTPVQKMILGNKCDIPSSISEALVIDLIEKYGIPHRLISAKDGIGIEKAFLDAIKTTQDQKKPPSPRKRNTIILQHPPTLEENKRCPC